MTDTRLFYMTRKWKKKRKTSEDLTHYFEIDTEFM